MSHDQHDRHVSVLRALGRGLGLPAMAFQALSAGEPGPAIVGGLRAAGAPTRVSPADLWNLGSLAQAVTASMLAGLAGEGLIAWDTRLGEVLPEFARSAFAGATLAQLLDHGAGLPPGPAGISLLPYLLFGGNPARLSERLVARAAKARPRPVPEGGDLSSDFGYALAARMAERVSGEALQPLLDRLVLRPAGMKGVVRGAPPQDGSAPFEHSWNARRGAWEVLRPARRAPEDLPCLAPSSGLCGRIGDLAALGRWQLCGAGSNAAPVAARQPAGRVHHALPGWRTAVAATGAPIVWQHGTSGGSYALLAFSPALGTGLAFATNALRPGWADRDGPVCRALLGLFD